MTTRTSQARRGVAGAVALLVVVSQLALPPQAEANHLGSSTASAGSAPPPAVSAIQSFQPDLFTGRATTTIPLVVPPGRKGLQPSLALSYASAGHDGWVGAGWSLDVGYIERNSKNGVPKYDGSDLLTFLVQGVNSDLVQIPDGTYRAKDEGAFLRFENHGVSGWVVTDKSGTRYLFGESTSSQIESSGKVFRWALDKVIDPNGNTITFTYTKDQGQLYPAQIDYTGHDPTGLAPSNQVLFVVEDRSDKDTSYRSGFAVTTAKRLKTIDTKAMVSGALSLARRYQLSYTTSTRTGRSLLASVTQLGSDGSTTLPPVTFTYQQSANSYSLTTLGQSLKQLLVGDVDGNAISELINMEGSTGTWSVSCVQACPGLSTGTWLTGFGGTTSVPLVGDWNGDGKTDVATFTGGNWQFATSTGSNFQTGTIASLSFGSGTPLSGDFNGDGKTDIGTYNNGVWSFAMASGSSFSPTSSFDLTWGDANHEPLTGDFNGDGLTDIGLVDKATGNIDVRLSTGTGWSPATTWLSGFGPNQEHTSADFTEDGLSDVVYYDRATGRVMVAASTGSAFGPATSLPVVFTQTSSNDVLQVGDFNGDGLLEPMVFNTTTGSLQQSFSQGSPADLLLSLTNGLGGATSLTYQPSAILGHTTLPFIASVVQTVTTTDGMGNSYTTTYNYDGGLYDAPTKEFRGFAKTQVIDAEHHVALTQFHQDEHRKGHVFHGEFRDAAGNLWTQADQTWTCSDLYANVHFTHLDQTDAYTYDGDATFKQARTRFAYDPYGNLTQTNEDGDLSVIGDERSSVTTFLYNPTAWILNKPSLTQTLDATGAVVAQRRFSYDGAAAYTTAPTVGNLTKEEEWLNLPTEQWLATTLTYDAYGNVFTVTDALTRTTTNTYDTTGTYLTQIQNALSQTRSLAYDPRFGTVTSSTDQNNQTTTTQYDALGRVTKVIGPTDTATLPTLSYTYDLSTLPNKTTVTTRIQSGAPDVLSVYAFTDGLGRAIQTRSPAEDPAKQVVTGTVQFNTRGLVIKQWVAYLSALSSSYVPLNLEPSTLNLAAVSYTYDPPGRALTVTDPDGSVTSTNYNDWAVTVTDSLGHKTTRTHDAYGRLMKVEEFNGAAVYTTTYQYDARNNLTKVTDHAGHLTTLAYDSLGRKLSMDDPDMGHWTYAYDAVDNLTSQTDARGVVTSFTYDVLNRLTHKDYTVPSTLNLPPSTPVSYTYDGTDDLTKLYAKGKLTKIADGSGSSSFEYDQLSRLVKESKTVDGTTSTIQRSYDLLGRLTSLTYPDNEQALYTYNPQGGIETITLQQGTTTQTIVSDMDYNAAGQLTKLTYGNGTISDYTYNPQTLRLAQLQTRNSQLGTLQDFSYTFDPVGNVTGITDRVHTATQSFQYDALNRLTQAVGSYGTSTYAYDPLGNMLSKEGATLTYGLSDGSKPHAVTTVHGPQSTVHRLTYDANGNLIENAVDRGLSTVDAAAQRLSYDAENRLVEVKTSQDATVTLTFQPGWNFFSLPVIPNNLRISAVFPTFASDFEQLSTVESDGSSKHFVNNSKFDDFSSLEYGKGYELYCKAAQAVTVTLKGKLPTTSASKSLSVGWQLLPALTVDTSKPLSWLLQGLSYDTVYRFNATTQQLEIPTEVQPGQAYFVHVLASSVFQPPLPRDPTTRFVYDGGGGRVKKITATGTTTYLGDAYELAPTGTTTKYLYAGGLRLAAKDSTGALRFYHTDHLGSSNVVTDAQGTVVELNENTPYGALSRHEGTTDVAHKFTGQRFDAETRLAFYQARYYDPTLGRFISPDPIIQDPADPQSLNRYAYVRNNPTNLVDPSGYKFSWKKLFHKVAKIATVVAVVATVVAIGALVVGHPEVAAVAFAVARGAALVAVAATVASAAIPEKSPNLSEVSGHLLHVKTGAPITPDEAAFMGRTAGGGRLPLSANGIGTPPQQAREQANAQQALVVFYNPTAGIIADLTEAAMSKWLGPTEIDKQFQRTLDRLTATGVPLDLTTYSRSTGIGTSSFESGAHLPEDSTVTLKAAMVSRGRAEAAVRQAGGTPNYIPTKWTDPINTIQDLNPIKMFGGTIGMIRDVATGFCCSAHDLKNYGTQAGQ